MGADSDAEAASLPPPTLSAKKVLSRDTRTKALNAKDLSREAKNEAPLSANSETILASLKITSLKGITLRIRAKPGLSREAKLKHFVLTTRLLLTSFALLGSARLTASDKTKALSA